MVIMMNNLFIYKDIIDNEKLSECVSSYFNSFKQIDKLKVAERIIIKVTLPALQKSSSAGMMTRHDFFEQIYTNIRKINTNGKIYVVESEFSGNISKIYKEQQYTKYMEKDNNFFLVDLDNSESLKITSDKFKKLGIITISDVLLDYDFFINLSVARRHIFEKYSGALAGMLSLVSDKSFRKRLYNYMSKTVYDINQLFVPDMVFIDARTVLTGAGPIQGEPLKKNIVIASSENYMADCIGARIIGEKESKIPHLKYFIKKMKLQKSKNINFPINSKTEFIPYLQYFIWRSSLFLNRLGDFIQRVAYLGQLGSFALMVTGFKDIVSGKWISIPNVIEIFNNMLFKLNSTEDLTDKRIVINKHIKDQVVS